MDLSDHIDNESLFSDHIDMSLSQPPEVKEKMYPTATIRNFLHDTKNMEVLNTEYVFPDVKAFYRPSVSYC